MEKRLLWPAAVLGVAIGLGIFLAGVMVSDAGVKLRSAQRYVTVKGLAEREVDADLAIWPLVFEETGNDLAALQRSVDEKRGIVRGFLGAAGFPNEEISQSPPRLRDLNAESYYGQPTERKFRFVAQATVLVRSRNVALVKATMERAGELVGKGVVLSGENYGRATEYLFTGLNAVKPEMIAEATGNARKAAEQFAKDSGSTVGKIRTATQGLFSISDRDMNTPERKIVRVVTTVEYFLVDR